MSKERTFTAVVSDGKAHLTAPVAYRQFLSQFGDGEELEFEIRPKRQRRSSQANRYYWGVVIKALSDYTGYEADEMHECLAMKFLRIEDDPITGSPRRKRTPKCNTAEFSEYVDRCIRFAAELGVVVPVRAA